MSIDYLCEILPDVSIAFSLIAFVIGLVCIKRITNYLLPILVLAGISLITESIIYIVGEASQNNLYVLHMFTVIEFTFISLFYWSFLKQYISASVIILLMIPVFVWLAYMDYKVNGLGSIDNFSISAECIILNIYAFFLFLYLMKTMMIENLLSSPVFWINTAVLCYFLGNLLLFTFSNYLEDAYPDRYYIMWAIIHSTINIIYNILISIGFWKAKLT